MKEKRLRSSACRSKSHYADQQSAEKAAQRLELRDCYVFQAYECDECDEWHLRTRKHHGTQVLSLDALRAKRRAERS